jgi:DNA polymerase-4
VAKLAPQTGVGTSFLSLVQITQPKLFCFGHRGASGHELENTVRAVRRALELGADGVEVDVHFVDDQLVVIHDDTLERTTNGHGQIADGSFADLRTLDAGFGERIPTLAEIFDVVNRRAVINVELKGPHTTAPVAALIGEYVNRYGWSHDDFLVSSFDPARIREVKQLCPEIRVGALIKKAPRSLAGIADVLGARSLHVSQRCVTSQLVAEAHRYGLKVFVFTVNQPEEIARMKTLGVDGAYVDVSAICQAETADASLLLALPMARELKQRILSERQLTATIGIASNKLLAKIASDHQKPDGLTVITDQEKVSFLRPLPVRTLYGVGKVTEQTLNKVGIVTIGDLQDYAGNLRAQVGSFGPKLKQFAFGEDDRPLEIGDEIKNISGEETFLKDTDDQKILRACLKEQAADISARHKHKWLGAHTVQVKVRYTDFTTLTRQLSVEEPLTEAGDIYRLGCFLLGREKLVSRPLRLLGLGVSNLREPTTRQLALL